MAIPNFLTSGVLPPFVGSTPAEPGGRAPYVTTFEHLIARFGFSPERKQLLHGLLAYRAQLRSIGIVQGFQWINGSFVEDCEGVRDRGPADIDLVTLSYRPANAADDHTWERLVSHNTVLFKASLTKTHYNCDAYYVDLNIYPHIALQQAVYWFGLFSHQRVTNIWKGSLAIDLDEEAGDAFAIDTIQSERSQ